MKRETLENKIGKMEEDSMFKLGDYYIKKEKGKVFFGCGREIHMESIVPKEGTEGMKFYNTFLDYVLQNVNKYRFCLLKRVKTRGIDSDLPFRIQVKLWESVDEELKNPEKVIDYFQVFSFERKDGNLVIKHLQERPWEEKEMVMEYKEEYAEIINKKVYIIDDVSHSTMLFSSEY